MQWDFRKRAILAGVVLVCVLAGVYAFWRSRAAVTSAQLAAAIPAGSSTVVFVDFESMRRAGILDRLAGPRTLEEPEYKNFVKEAGFDYRRDLDGAAVGFEGDSTFLALRGRFDWSALRRYAAAQKGACDGDYCRIPSSQPGRTISYYPARAGWFGKGNVLAMASAVSPDAARRVGFASSNSAPPVPAAPLWLATTGSALRRTASLPTGTLQFARLFSQAERIVFTVAPDQSNFELTVDAQYPTPQDAAVMLVQVEALTAMLRKMIASEKQKPSPTDLSGVLTSGTFRKDDRRVMGRWPIRREFLESLAGGP